jgi:predicted nuclease with TOPRIM domain
MREQLAQRLKELNAEFAAGQKMLVELEAKQANLRETLLRISGAIQVLSEELSRADQTTHANGAGATEERLEGAEQPTPETRGEP